MQIFKTNFLMNLIMEEEWFICRQVFDTRQYDYVCVSLCVWTLALCSFIKLLVKDPFLFSNDLFSPRAVLYDDDNK